MMNCQEAEKKMEQAEATTPLSQDVVDHVSSCDACSKLMSQRSKVDRALSMVARAKVPSGLGDRAFRAAIAGESRLTTPTFWQRLLPIVAPAATVAALAGIAAILFARPDIQPAASLDDEVAFELVDTSDVEFALADDLFLIGDDE